MMSVPLELVPSDVKMKLGDIKQKLKVDEILSFTTEIVLTKDILLEK
jgi:hypothetical protein